MSQRRISPVRACVEVAFIIFLFYANLLMGEFTRSSGAGKSWGAAFADMVTAKNFAVAMLSAVVGFIVFETLRRKV
jgi:hypothetical protein